MGYPARCDHYHEAHQQQRQQQVKVTQGEQTQYAHSDGERSSSMPKPTR